MDKNPYKSPEVIREAKPTDDEPPLPAWRMRLCLAAIVIGGLMVACGVLGHFPQFRFPNPENVAFVGLIIAGYGLLFRRRKPKRFWLPPEQK